MPTWCPVHGKNGVSHGAALLLHDASSPDHARAARPVAAREGHPRPADAGRQPGRVRPHPARAASSRTWSGGLPCSLIICDIDHFKRINDTFGHQAGDEVLIAFAALLRRHCRSGDLVARYGGEEFVMLCADCDNATATRRAEELRVGAGRAAR